MDTKHVTNNAFIMLLLLVFDSAPEILLAFIVEVDENGDEFKRPALDWSDYFHKNPEATGMTRGEKVVSEFWVRYVQSKISEQHLCNLKPMFMVLYTCSVCSKFQKEINKLLTVF